MPVPTLSPRQYRLVGKLNKVVNKLEHRLQRSRLLSRPISVDLVLTRACNLSCVFCKDYETPHGARRVSVAALERIAPQLFPYATQLSICSGGEPYLHPDLLAILRLARRYGLDIWLLSNGMLMTADLSRSIIREGLVTKHGISFDGHDPATVAAIRLGADPERILENVRTFLRIRADHGKRLPRLIIRYALMRANIEELPAAVDHFGRLGADEVNCNYLSLAGDLDPNESLFYHQELLERTLIAARRAAVRHPHLRLVLPPTVAEWRRRTGPALCKAPWSFVMIDTNGEVMPCYRAYEALRLPSLHADGAPGFARVWNSEPYRRLRATANRDDRPGFFPYCRQCEYRVGWGNERSHLGDRGWLEAVAAGGGVEVASIDHRRPGVRDGVRVGR